MSIINCKYCNQDIDTDFNSEHEDLCFFDNVLDGYLADSATFEEFFQKADNEIAEHLQQTNGGKEPLSDEVKDYAREIFDEYTDGQMPF